MGFYISYHLDRCRRSWLLRDLGGRRPHFQDSFYYLWCAILAGSAGGICDWRSLLLTRSRTGNAGRRGRGSPTTSAQKLIIADHQHASAQLGPACEDHVDLALDDGLVIR